MVILSFLLERDIFVNRRESFRCGIETACQERPVPFTDTRQTPEEAAELCGVGSPGECPLLALCEAFGYTEGRVADDMVYGGKTWRKGVPIVSETAYSRRLARLEEVKAASRYR